MREGWKYKTLGTVSFYPNERIRKENIQFNRYIGVENLVKNLGGINLSDELPDIDSAVKFEKGDILIGNIRPYLRKGWLSTFDGGASGDVIVIRIRKEYKEIIKDLFLYKILTSDKFFEFDNSHTKGAKMPRGDKNYISKFTIPVPPLAEQERIVAELDLLTEIIDKQKAQLKELDTLAQSIFYDMFGNPVENEKGWEVACFKQVFQLKSGDGLSEKNFVLGKYPVYGGNGISGYHNSFNKKGPHIIIGRVGAYCGNVRYVNEDFWLTDNAFDALFDFTQFDFWYTCYLLNTMNLHQYANHVAQPVISNTGLKELNVIIPPLSLQRTFADKITAIEQQKAAITQSIADTQKLFDYTMDKYFG